MPNILSAFFYELGELVNQKNETSEDEHLFEHIEAARQDWINAHDFFEQVSEPDLVDMAIYSLDAAEKRYMYLLKLAKVRGMQLPNYPVAKV